jgi:histone deacetylase 1/2
MYASQLINKLKLAHLKPVLTPLATGVDLHDENSEFLHDPKLYRSILGALQYLTYTRPDLSFAVNQLSQFMQVPRLIHWQTLKRMLRYVKGTLHYGLHFKLGANLNITGFSDANCGCDTKDRRSVVGYCVYLGNSLSWSSKKQQIVSRSSIESEYRALANVAAEILWLKSLLSELHMPLTVVPVAWCDNISANHLAHNPMFHSRTKHIKLIFTLSGIKYSNTNSRFITFPHMIK